MNSYTRENPPKRGTARRIWKAMGKAGITLYELHYNANLWGRGMIDGWGTWACTLESDELDYGGYWCGWIEDRGFYLQLSYAPYTVAFPQEKAET